MAQIDQLPAGRVICDPASGVGGFVLEQMARDLESQWRTKPKLLPIHSWLALELVPKTAVLAKANALVHCGELLAENPGRVKAFSAWLSKAFQCKNRTSLGSLEGMDVEKYDLILSNPPFVVSGSKDIGKLIRSNNRRKKYFGQKASGVEGLFVQYIVQALKPNADAWVLLPETFFLRTTDRALRDWVLSNCKIDLFAMLPESTFFNTPKRVVICHLKKRAKRLSEEALSKAVEAENALIYAVGEIGETRDRKRLPCESHLPALVAAYKSHLAGHAPDDDSRATVVACSKLLGRDSLNLRHFWPRKDARALGLLGLEADPTNKRDALNLRMERALTAAAEWRSVGAQRVPPPQPTQWRTVSLGDSALFALKIGSRVLKKDIHALQSGVPLYSANVRARFGYVQQANAGGLAYGGALWSIDSDFDCRHVAPGERYAITDHCGEVTLLVDSIDPGYLASQLRQAGADMGFSRDFRPSLRVMAKVEIDLPVLDDGTFDIGLMRRWSEFAEEIDKQAQALAAAVE
jgi:hypothetical protein